MWGIAFTCMPESNCDASQPETLRSRKGTRPQMYTLLVMQGTGRALLRVLLTGRAAATALKA